jgi:hypothetical protein
MSDSLASNLADGIDRASVSVRRPWCLFVSISFGLVVLFVGGGPLAATLSEQSRVIVYHAKVGAGSTAPLLAASSPPPPPPSTSSQVATATSSTGATAPANANRSPSVCGDGVCDAPSETISSCFADCPGPSTDASCGEGARATASSASASLPVAPFTWARISFASSIPACARRAP